MPWPPQGLEQLRVASGQAELLAAEAQFELARIYGIREGRHAESLRLFEALAERYPGNALYSLSAAFQAEAAGQKEQALALARRAEADAASMDERCGRRFGEAARGAVLRLEPPAGVAIFRKSAYTFTERYIDPKEVGDGPNPAIIP